ncbi:hypothetical protein [Klebsiella pneumoniae]|uniref:hypothetical protein n=1 Tax=Klebsiella pneumoniae TaxID=573 RepID=UPI001887BC6E|nr:hypothetical protein [Klebsiella pneumoniae]
MRNFLILFVLFLFPIISAFAGLPPPKGYEKKAIDLLNQQDATLWQHYNSAEPFLQINGRRFSLTPDDFEKILYNTFRQCEDLDAYTNRKGVTDNCEAYIFKGFKEWIALSKDKTVSDYAWKIGISYASNTRNPMPSMNVWDFNGWAAGIRVAKSKGY